MIDLQHSLKVENITKPKIGAALIRCWVTLTQDGKDIFKRRSVILHTGENDIKITWAIGELKKFFAQFGVLYKNYEDLHPAMQAKVVDSNNCRVTVSYGDTVTLHWIIIISPNCS